MHSKPSLNYKFNKNEVIYTGFAKVEAIPLQTINLADISNDMLTNTLFVNFTLSKCSKTPPTFVEFQHFGFTPD